MKKLSSILVAGVMATLGLSAISQPANAAGHRADVDMVAACLYQYQGAYRADVVIIEQNVMGWRCYINGYRPPKDYLLDINVSAWCKHKYGGGAGYDDFNDPYSWYCSY